MAQRPSLSVELVVRREVVVDMVSKTVPPGLYVVLDRIVELL